MKPKASDLWSWRGSLSGTSYFGWGLALAIVKWNVDRGIAAVCFGRSWTIFDADTLRMYFWQSPLKQAYQPYFLTLTAVSLPFLWAGMALTLRRLRTLGWRPFWGLLFFVPMVKFLFFAVLCLLRSEPERRTPPTLENAWDRFCGRILPRGLLASAAMAIVLSSLVMGSAVWLGTAVFRNYGWTLFVGLPFCMGFLSVLLDSFRDERGLGRCLLVANLTVVVVGLGLFLVAMEGAICILMAAPLAIGLATIGGAMGYAVQKAFWWRDASPKLFCSVLLLVPASMSLEHAVPPGLPLLAVRSSVIVDAPPEKVWRNVVAFTELPPPKEWIFKLGIAYPIRAEMDGRGAGAVRHCQFSTGAFVEPIAVWDEPRLLRFSVTENPEPMQEWTPYRKVHPAHLDGYLESRAGQFRLLRMDGGRTLLEGTTWYYHHLWPAGYWRFWSDHIIHCIHLRVLNHVKQLSESSTT